MKGNFMVEYENVEFVVDFVKCCDVCEYSPFKQGYSGRRNNGLCKKRKAFCNRATTCGLWKQNDKMITKRIGGMKGQVKWYKEDYAKLLKRKKCNENIANAITIQ